MVRDGGAAAATTKDGDADDAPMAAHPAVGGEHGGPVATTNRVGDEDAHVTESVSAGDGGLGSATRSVDVSHGHEASTVGGDGPEMGAPPLARAIVIDGTEQPSRRERHEKGGGVVVGVGEREGDSVGEDDGVEEDEVEGVGEEVGVTEGVGDGVTEVDGERVVLSVRVGVGEVVGDGVGGSTHAPATSEYGGVHATQRRATVPFAPDIVTAPPTPPV